VKVGDLVTVMPASTGMYIIVGQCIMRNNYNVEPHDCWLLFSAGEGWVMPMGKEWVEALS